MENLTKGVRFMSDMKEKILGIIGHPFLAAFATVTPDGKPWVRYVVAMADPADMTIRFATFANARKVQQIKANPAVHLTGGATDLMSAAPYVQVEGTAQLIQEKKKLHAAWNDMLANYFQGPDDPNYALIEITPSRIELWGANAENPMQPEVWEA